MAEREALIGRRGRRSHPEWAEGSHGHDQAHPERQGRPVDLY